MAQVPEICAAPEPGKFRRGIRRALEALRLWPARRAYLAVAIGVAVAAFLLFPGNPVWDWSVTKLPNTIWVYLCMLLCAAAVIVERDVILQRAAARGSRRLWLSLLATTVVIGGVFAALHIVRPDYLKSLSHEWGLIEPVTWLLYLCGVVFSTGHVAALRAAGREYRPYRLVTAFYFVLLMEECDWLGIFGGIFGRVEGIYMGSLHDIIKFVYELMSDQLGVVAICAALVAVLAFVCLRRELSWRFVGREILAPSTLILYVGLACTVLAEAYDIDPGEIVPGLPNPAELSGGFVEESLEMVLGIAVFYASLMKYTRDARQGLLGRS